MSTALSQKHSYRLSIFSRILAASFGAYVLVNIVSVFFTFVLPLDKYNAFLFGVQSNFLVYTLAIIWVFAARSAARAWIGLLTVSLPLLAVDCAYYFQGAGV